MASRLVQRGMEGGGSPHLPEGRGPELCDLGSVWGPGGEVRASESGRVVSRRLGMKKPREQPLPRAAPPAANPGAPLGHPPCTGHCTA